MAIPKAIEFETEMQGLIDAVRSAAPAALPASGQKADQGERARRFFRALAMLFSAYHSRQNWPHVQNRPVVAIPPDIAVIIASQSEYLAVGKIPEPMLDCVKGSGRTAPGPHEQKCIKLAVAYVKAAQAGEIDDSTFIKTVSEAYGVNSRTVHGWKVQFKDLSPASLCDGELKLLPALMRKAGERYQYAGRSIGAIRRRNAKQKP